MTSPLGQRIPLLLAGQRILDELGAFRVVRCWVCGGADCLGAIGRLCNSQRPGVARALPPEPAPVPEVFHDPRQLTLFRNVSRSP